MSIIYAESRFDAAHDERVLNNRAKFDAVCEVPHRLEARRFPRVDVMVMSASAGAIAAVLAMALGGWL